MSIRPYATSDWEAVRQIYDLSKSDELRGLVDPRAIVSLSDDETMLKLFRESEILVFELSDRVVGFGGCKGSYISWLFVHPDSRRQGIARSLLAEILSRLSGPISLNVAAENDAAVKLYKSFGFTVEREFLGQYKDEPVRVLTLIANR